MTLSNRVALITGSKRIGAAVAMDLAAHGADVALVYNQSRDEADATAQTIRAAGRKALVMQADVSSAGECARIVEETVRELGRIDVLVNMASIYRARDLDQLTAGDWNRQLDVDLRAAFLCAHAAMPHMRGQGGGRIINFSDWVAASGRPRYTGYVPYYVAKHGVIALTEALALELAPAQILVNAIAPGPIVPPPGTSDEEQAEVARTTPLGRWGGEDEIVKAVRFLVESDYVTGETIRVDGGRHLR